MNNYIEKFKLKYHMLRKNEHLVVFSAMTLCTLLVASFMLYSTFFSAQSQALAQTAADSSVQMNTYNNPAYGVTMQYPADWQKLEGEGNLLGRFKVNDTTLPIVGFTAPDLSVEVFVATEKLLKNITLDQYVEQTIAELKKDQPGLQIVEQNKTTLAGLPAYKLVFTGPFDFAGAMKRFGLGNMVEEATGGFIDIEGLNNLTLTGTQYIIMRGNNSYILGYGDTSDFIKAILGNSPLGNLGMSFPGSTGSNLGEEPSQYPTLAQKMIDSFELTSLDQSSVGQATVNSSQSNISQTPNQTQNTAQDPCSIISLRLARGEIPIEEFERLRETLKC